MGKTYGPALNTATPGAAQASKVTTVKKMNNLKEKKEVKKTKTNIG